MPADSGKTEGARESRCRCRRTPTTREMGGAAPSWRRRSGPPSLLLAFVATDISLPKVTTFDVRWASAREVLQPTVGTGVTRGRSSPEEKVRAFIRRRETCVSILHRNKDDDVCHTVGTSGPHVEVLCGRQRERLVHREQHQRVLAQPVCRCRLLFVVKRPDPSFCMRRAVTARSDSV